MELRQNYLKREVREMEDSFILMDYPTILGKIRILASAGF
jgi:hypothetical protein